MACAVRIDCISRNICRIRLVKLITCSASGGRAVFEFRVTKYDPAHRDARGAYTRDEWTSVGDIGRTVAGAVLTESEYQRVEDAYTAAAVAYLREAGLAAVMVSGLENYASASLPFAEGSRLGLSEAGAVVRRLLREE